MSLQPQLLLAKPEFRGSCGSYIVHYFFVSIFFLFHSTVYSRESKDAVHNSACYLHSPVVQLELHRTPHM